MKQFYITSHDVAPEQWVKLGVIAAKDLTCCNLEGACIVWISTDNKDWVSLVKETRKKNSNIAVISEKLKNSEFKISIEVGARAYCDENISTSELVNIVDALISNAIWVPSGLINFVISKISSQDRFALEVFSKELNLSQRESEVLARILEGKSNKEISGILQITVRTVKAHVMSLLQKCNAKDRIELLVKIFFSK